MDFTRWCANISHLPCLNRHNWLAVLCNFIRYSYARRLSSLGIFWVQHFSFIKTNKCSSFVRDSHHSSTTFFFFPLLPRTTLHFFTSSMINHRGTYVLFFFFYVSQRYVHITNSAETCITSCVQLRPPVVVPASLSVASSRKRSLQPHGISLLLWCKNRRETLYRKKKKQYVVKMKSPFGHKNVPNDRCEVCSDFGTLLFFFSQSYVRYAIKYIATWRNCKFQKSNVPAGKNTIYTKSSGNSSINSSRLVRTAIFLNCS